MSSKISAKDSPNTEDHSEAKLVETIEHDAENGLAAPMEQPLSPPVDTRQSEEQKKPRVQIEESNAVSFFLRSVFR